MTKREIIKKLENELEQLPKTVSDKVYDAVTVYEGIQEISDYGKRLGIEACLMLLKEK